MASLAVARTRLGYATLHAPLSGVVLSENVEVGEYVLPEAEALKEDIA